MKMKIFILHTKFVELILEKLEIQIQSVIRKPLSFRYQSNFPFQHCKLIGSLIAQELSALCLTLM
jgi:hypothetical protein